MSVCPNQAILFHQASIDTHSQSMAHNFATLHAIQAGADNRPVILEGKLMSHDCLISVLKDMAGMKQKKAIQCLPENVIAQDSDSLVWHVPGSVRTMLFKQGNKTTKITVPYPSLIFKVTDNNLSIAACKYKRKPKSDDMIYHAPLMNIYVDGRVCVGSADCPDNADIESMAGWESVIFDTIFTHTNHSYTLNHNENKLTLSTFLFRFWKSIRGNKQFPNKYLNTLSDITLQEWIEQ